MPISKNPPDKRNYKKEDRYEDTPAQVRHREERNALRAQETRKLGHNPVGKDVAHITPLAGGGKNDLTNARVESIKKNRSWRAGQKGYRVPKDV